LGIGCTLGYETTAALLYFGWTLKPSNLRQADVQLPGRTTPPLPPTPPSIPPALHHCRGCGMGGVAGGAARPCSRVWSTAPVSGSATCAGAPAHPPSPIDPCCPVLSHSGKVWSAEGPAQVAPSAEKAKAKRPLGRGRAGGGTGGRRPGPWATCPPCPRTVGSRTAAPPPRGPGPVGGAAARGHTRRSVGFRLSQSVGYFSRVFRLDGSGQ